MKHLTIPCFPVQTLCLGKFYFRSLRPKCSCLTKLHYLERIKDILGFLHGDSHQQKVACKTAFFCGCGQECADSSNVFETCCGCLWLVSGVW